MSNKLTLCLILLFLLFSLCGCTEQKGVTIENDRDEDGVIDEEDAFPADPSASIDTDGDNYPDEWNLGKSKSDSTSNPKLSLDIFPNDPNEHEDSDGDGVGDNKDAFPFDSTQWSDIDGDNHGDNPNGNEADEFKYDSSEWRDSDNDGIGDNADIYDYGNAGIKVKINEYHCDDNLDGSLDWSKPDTYFTIDVYSYKTQGGSSNYLGTWKSQVFYDALNIYNPYSFIIDVDDDIQKIYVDIEAYDEDIDEHDRIDLSGDSIITYATNTYFYPQTYSSKTFDDDGRLDLEDETDGWIDYTIEVIKN